MQDDDISYMIDFWIFKDGDCIEEDLSDLTLEEKKELLKILDLIPFSPEFTYLYDVYDDDIEKAIFKLNNSRVYFDYPIFINDCFGCFELEIKNACAKMNEKSKIFSFRYEIDEWERAGNLDCYVHPSDECNNCKKTKIA